MSAFDADITAIVGATGSGKSLYIRSRLPALARALIWDWKGEYRRCAHVIRGRNAPSALAAALAAAGAGPFSISYVPDKRSQEAVDAQWGFVCRAAFAVGRCALIGEELQLVARPGHSAPGWLQVVTEGRGRGLVVIGVTPRPALVDKTFLDAATLVRCGRLNNPASRRFMADLLDVNVERLRALLPLQWIEKNMATGELREETLERPGAPA